MNALEMEPYQFQPPGLVFDSASINSLDEAAEAMEWRLKTPYQKTFEVQAAKPNDYELFFTATLDQ